MKTPTEVKQIFNILKQHIPTVNTELDYKNPYTFLVAVILSAQSTDKGVNKATPALFEVADTSEKMIKLGLDGLKYYIKTIGLYNNKAKNIISMSEELINNFNGEVPHNREQLESLSGVGRKTANVVLNVIWNEPTIGIDTHIIRLSNRLDFSTNTNPLKIEKDLDKLIPNEDKNIANHLLVLFGRYTCKAQKPECLSCPISALCNSKDKRLS